MGCDTMLYMVCSLVVGIVVGAIYHEKVAPAYEKGLSKAHETVHTKVKDLKEKA